MNTLRISLILALFAFTVINAQETQIQEPKTNTITNQFEDLIDNSNNFQDYKVVKENALIRLKNNAGDSITNLKGQISTLQEQIDSQQSSVKELNDSLTETKNTLAATIEEKDSINFFGIPMSKGGYMSMMWGIVGVLSLALLFFIYKYRGSNSHTQEARKKLNDTELEYDEYRKKALEKEQKMGRMLQDERNKALKSTKK